MKGCCDTSNNGEGSEGCCNSSKNETKKCCDSKGQCGSKANPDEESGKVGTNSCCSAKPSTVCCSSGTCGAAENAERLTYHCLALIRPDNSNVIDVFDAKGKSKSFRSSQKHGGKLCFSSHDAGNDADGLLSPCFDENGNHGEPMDPCFCGVDEPHIHAHMFNPDRCGGDGCIAGRNGRKPNLGFLAQLTLFEVEGITTPLLGDNVQVGSVPISENLPNECNSSDISRFLTEKGFGVSQWRTWSRGARRRSGVGVGNDEAVNRNRMYPILHEDHTDFLIYNRRTENLHLEHPCDSCGSNDIHGKFRLTHSRRWKIYDERSGQKTDPKEISLNFFEAESEPFSLLDFLSGFFELDSNRDYVSSATDTLVDAAAEISPPTVAPDGDGARVGRSHFFVEKICCASEARAINSIVKPLEGVLAITVNTTSKIVYVDHHVDILSAADIAGALNQEQFGCHVKKDAAQTMAQRTGIPTDCFVKSTFEIIEFEKADSVEGFLRTEIPDDHIMKTVEIDSVKKILTVHHNPYYLTASSIKKHLESTAIKSSLLSDGGADGMWALSQMSEPVEEILEQHRAIVRWNIILSGICWMLSMLSYIGGKWIYLKYVGLLSVAFGLPPIALKAYRTLRRLHFDVNCMMLFATVGAVALQEFTEAAAVTFLFSISEALESIATSRARNALSAIVQLRPDRASVINPITKQIVVLPASAVPIGTLVSVKTGDKVPCDGCVVEGQSTVDESNLTGESIPVKKGPGSMVSGGTTNNGATQLVVQTTATADQSAVAKLIRLVEEAQTNRSETEKLVDRFAAVYTPIVLLAALCMCTIPWAFGNEKGRAWVMTGLITIVIACPCALIISTPVTYVAALAAAAQRGIVIKGGAYLEAMGSVKEIAFDKTGTLTEGVFALLHFESVSSRSRKEVLEYLTLMESPASHPLSHAIIKGAANEQVKIPKDLSLQNHTLLPGEGIAADIDGKKVHVGNIRLFKRLGYYDELSKTNRDTVEEWAQSGGTVGLISIEGEGITGMFSVTDKVRDESKSVVAALKERGISIKMLTGDLTPAALCIGKQIGLSSEDVKSQLLPEDKVEFIANAVQVNKNQKRWWKSTRNVMMVGDGVNDAPALALADVSVAMGEGAALAMEASDVTLMDSNLEKLVYMTQLGRRVIRTIVENVTFSLVTKAIVMGFAFAGRASLWAAIVSDVGAMLLVTLNGMKLLPSSRKVRENDLLVSPVREENCEHVV
eukprot:CAMPEP_0171356732 /NCGR_PEP_ID=MMETSP0878-20121228/45878_1 /TAXON_ID=67004 /ORGANISM="Thalassiosira weissflogii, Strain CCMP1336" /LENGTH=1229 /DNA_ID=CAMNT_0011862759 /DNA_START=432 /DNA_END=4121 /DNA_ORIENTATION=-